MWGAQDVTSRELVSAHLAFDFRPLSWPPVLLRFPGVNCPIIDIHEHSQHLTDGRLLADWPSQGQLGSDPVEIAATVLLLLDVSRLDQVVDDVEGPALSDTEHRGDISKPHPGILSDADERLSMIGKEAPFGHATEDSRKLLEMYIPETCCIRCDSRGY